ncbi:hypothetical protein BDY24DRAFT_384613 [Mrakia frigida]|uniref:uncharacterized protein n=1 Tax=Mrakia frigida TaxID=29902 RepID=UPI003FCC2240
MGWGRLFFIVAPRSRRASSDPLRKWKIIRAVPRYPVHSSAILDPANARTLEPKENLEAFCWPSSRCLTFLEEPNTKSCLSLR